MKNKNLFGSIVLFITALVWGVAFVFQRTGMDHIGPFTFMASRCVLAVIFIGAIVAVKGKSIKEVVNIDKKTLKGGAICGLFLTAAVNLQQMGLVYTTAGKAGFITAMYIVLVPFAAFLVFKKKPSLREVAGALIGLVGLYLLCVKEGFTVTTGDMWVFACALFFTGHILSCDHFGADSDPIKLSFVQFIVTTILSWVLALALETPSWAPIWEARMSIAYVGIVSAGVGYTLQMVGQKYTDPTAASLIMSLESVIAALSGWILINETMSGKEFLGCVIMFIAIIIVEIKGKENE